MDFKLVLSKLLTSFEKENIQYAMNKKIYEEKK